MTDNQNFSNQFFVRMLGGTILKADTKFQKKHRLQNFFITDFMPDFLEKIHANIMIVVEIVLDYTFHYSTSGQKKATKLRMKCIIFFAQKNQNQSNISKNLERTDYMHNYALFFESFFFSPTTRFIAENFSNKTCGWIFEKLISLWHQKSSFYCQINSFWLVTVHFLRSRGHVY